MADAQPPTTTITTETLPTNTPRPPRKPRPNYNRIHRHPLPLQTHPLPAFLPHHPLSLLRLAYALLSSTITSTPPLPQYHGYYDAFTNSVHVTDSIAIRALWEQGFFGKGSLSRSEPEWEKLRREREEIEREGRGAETAAEVTRKRREERRKVKLERAREEAEALEEQLRVEGKLGVKGEGELKRSEKIERDAAVDADGSLGMSKTGKDALDDGSRTQLPNDHLQQEETPQETSIKEREPVLAAASAFPTPLSDENPSHLEQKPSPTGTSTTTPPKTSVPNQEHLQLSSSEAFFLTYALGVLCVHASPTSSTILKPHDLLRLFSTDPLSTACLQLSHFSPSPNANLAGSTPSLKLKPQNTFLPTYATYHHYRSLGWVVRSGLKFGCDFLLYYRGPAFSHAEFAVLIIPDYSSWSDAAKLSIGDVHEKKRDWWWLHAANRVQSQVRKTLVLVYVEVPEPDAVEETKEEGEGSVDIKALLQQYKVREFVLKRWTPNRDRG